ASCASDVADVDGGPTRGHAGGDASDADGLWAGDLAEPAIHVGGGATTSAAGRGGDGGRIDLQVAGPITHDPALAHPSSPIPEPPAGGARLVADELAADVSRSGSIRLDAVIEVPGGDGQRTIESRDGDLIIAGA